MPKNKPPFNDPSEAIFFIRDNYMARDMDGFLMSWREVAAVVSQHMAGETSKAVMWNVAHKKYKCPPDVAKALREMNLLKSTKRWRFFYEVANEEEYEHFKELYLHGRSFTEWVEDKRAYDDLAEDWD